MQQTKQTRQAVRWGSGGSAGCGGQAGWRSNEAERQRNGARRWLITRHPWPAAWWLCHHLGRSALATAER